MKDSERFKLPLLYACASLFAASLQCLFNALVLYLIFQFFRWKYGSGLYPQRAHFYDSVSFALFSAMGGASHYFQSMLAALLTRDAKTRWACVASGTAATAWVAFSLASKSSFASGGLAALPVIAAYFAGGALGLRVEESDNPWRKSRFFRKKDAT